MIGGMKIYASGKGNKHIARMRSIQLRLMEATKISMGGHKLQPIIWGVRKIVQRNEALRLEDALINHHIDNYLEKVPKFHDSYELCYVYQTIRIYDHYSFHLGIQEAVRWYVYKKNKEMIRKCHNFMVHYRKSVRLSMCVSDIDMSKVQKAERDRIKKLKQGVANNRGKYWDIRKLALLESVKNVTKEVNKYKEYERQKRKEKRDNRGLVEKCRSERLRRGETYF
jgi:hypothetical protein